jgi:flagellin-like hook-associated protein FlgL
MTISIQSSNPALAALEALALQQGGAANAGTAAGVTPATTTAPPAADSAAAIVSVGAGPSSTSLSGGFLSSASAADAAVSAGSSIESLLGQMRQDALSAADPGLDSDARAALDTGFKANMASIGQAVAGASVDGLNLIDGSSGSGAGATLAGINLSIGGPLIGLASDSSLSDPAGAAAIAEQLGSAVDNVGQAMGQIAAQGQAIQTHLSVIAKAGLALQPSLGGAVNSSLGADGARLAALQVQQQLSASSGPVASQSQGILALFR